MALKYLLFFHQQVGDSINVKVFPNNLITVVISDSVMSPKNFLDASLPTDGCTCSEFKKEKMESDFFIYFLKE